MHFLQELSFIPNWPTLLAFIAAALVLSVTPGPDMTLFLGKTLSQGTKAGIASLIGASSGLLFHTFFAVVGISALIKASATAFFILKIIGALYLLWLAIDAIRNGSAFKVKEDNSKQSGFFKNWLTGVGINLLNPKIVLFYITFLPQFISANDAHATGKLIFLGLFFVIITTPICIAIILTANQFSSWLIRHPKVMRTMDYCFAGLFSSFAVKMLLSRA
jgi:threonine/homoserine/homoserine lactone efflux protein